MASANPAPLSGLVVALCCHHRCSLETYCNPDFILHECRLTPAEFSLVQTMSAYVLFVLGIDYTCVHESHLTLATCRWGTLSPEFDPTEDPANRHGYGSLKERFHAMNAYAAAANAPRAESNLGGFAAELGGSSESEKRRADTTDERSRSNDQDAVVAQPPAKIAAVEHSESANGDGAATKSDPQDGEDDDEDDEEVDEHAAAAEEHCATATATCAR